MQYTEHRTEFSFPFRTFELNFRRNGTVLTPEVEVCFDRIDLRLHKDPENHGWGFCSISLPGHDDGDEGFVLEDHAADFSMDVLRTAKPEDFRFEVTLDLKEYCRNPNYGEAGLLKLKHKEGFGGITLRNELFRVHAARP